jgi:AcrR family transcriptional regulator
MTAPRRDRRAERHLATRREILDAAWRLARERGLTGWTLRDVADAVGMRPPSLYVYVDGKNAVYDAMYADGYAELLARGERARTDLAARGASDVDVLRAAALLFFDFGVEDPARLHLLFLRTVPGFEPSEPAYALARRALDELAAVLTAAGLSTPAHLDLWTALVTGLTTQQVSNDPGGNRWRDLVGPAVDMFVAAHLPTGTPHRQSSSQPG